MAAANPPHISDQLRQRECNCPRLTNEGSMPMTTRRAACSCGKLEIVCEGEPVRISMCHCLECQRRTGAVFGGQAWFALQQTTVSGHATQFTRRSDAGRSVSFR